MNIQDAVAAVMAHPDYHVLRRFEPQPVYFTPPEDEVIAEHIGVYIDTETTGVDTRKDNIIEIALVRFVYDQEGHILRVDEGHSFLNDPGIPLDDKIRSITGISTEDVAGKVIDAREIDRLLDDVEIVVAHNAAFDRKICERYFPRFAEIPWACSQQDVPWRAVYNAPGLSLEVIAAFVGNVFYNAHRALIDCQVGVHVLACTHDQQYNAFTYALESSQKETLRVWAVGSPFHTKDALKGRGYHWNDGTDGRPKAWHKRVAPEELDEESIWLRTKVGAYPQVTTINSLDKYSIREQ